jgi:hypothetical protein
MKNKLVVTLCLVAINACSQTNTDVVNYLNKGFPSLNFGYVFFFEPELIEYCGDSIHRVEILKAIARQKKWINEDTEESAKERKVLLSILHQRIKDTNVQTEAQNNCKKFLLHLLSEFKIDFAVDEKLLEARFNPKNRGLPFGDEECDTDFSYFVFFLYNPALYVKVMKSNKLANPSGSITFPTTCILEELNHTPQVMKRRMQNELLKILGKYEGPEYDSLRNKIKNADLKAKFN